MFIWHPSLIKKHVSQYLTGVEIWTALLENKILQMLLPSDPILTILGISSKETIQNLNREFMHKDVLYKIIYNKKLKANLLPHIREMDKDVKHNLYE